MPVAETAVPGSPSDGEKFQFDKEIRLREIALKEAEEARHKEESERSRWTNPFIVAIIGACVVGIGNAVVSVINAHYQRTVTVMNADYQRDLLERTNEMQGYLENMRAENTSVLEVIKLSDPEKVRNGLCMLQKLNSIKSPVTNVGIQSYLADHQGCPSTPPPSRAYWVDASLIVPGCGISGCYQPYSVCGSVPTNTKTTGNTRNYVDTFGGAWGDWGGAASITQTQVCRTFTQHSHNVTRAVSFQFEVEPTS